MLDHNSGLQPRQESQGQQNHRVTRFCMMKPVCLYCVPSPFTSLHCGTISTPFRLSLPQQAPAHPTPGPWLSHSAPSPHPQHWGPALSPKSGEEASTSPESLLSLVWALFSKARRAVERSKGGHCRQAQKQLEAAAAGASTEAGEQHIHRPWELQAGRVLSLRAGVEL